MLVFNQHVHKLISFPMFFPHREPSKFHFLITFTISFRPGTAGGAGASSLPPRAGPGPGHRMAPGPPGVAHEVLAHGKPIKNPWDVSNRNAIHQGFEMCLVQKSWILLAETGILA